MKKLNIEDYTGQLNLNHVTSEIIYIENTKKLI